MTVSELRAILDGFKGECPVLMTTDSGVSVKYPHVDLGTPSYHIKYFTMDGLGIHLVADNQGEEVLFDWQKANHPKDET